MGKIDNKYMKKISLFFLMLLTVLIGSLVTCVNISCSSGNNDDVMDEENPHNPNESVNGSGNTNRVKYIKKRESGHDVTEVTEFVYDNKGRIIRCFTYYEGDREENGTSISYFDNYIDWYRSRFYVNENGKVDSMYYYDTDIKKNVDRYYYITKKEVGNEVIVERKSYRDRSKSYESRSSYERYTFTVDNKYKYYSETYNVGGAYMNTSVQRHNATFGDEPNNSNIDLNPFISYVRYDMSVYLTSAGYSYCPRKNLVTSSDNYRDYTYIRDKNGYVEKVTYLTYDSHSNFISNVNVDIIYE